MAIDFKGFHFPKVSSFMRCSSMFVTRRRLQIRLRSVNILPFTRSVLMVPPEIVPLRAARASVFNPFSIRVRRSSNHSRGRRGMASRVVLATWKRCPRCIMPSIMACRSKIFCNSAFNAFGNVVRRLWVGAWNLDWQSILDLFSIIARKSQA